MKTDIVFENLKVGQKLYSLMFGEVEITEIGVSDRNYPIGIKYIDSEGDTLFPSFSKDGKYHLLHNLPTLFLTNPFEKLNQERVIEVFDGKVWIKRVLVTIKCDVAICWNSADSLELAKSETSTSRWSEWRELQPEQPAAEQPKEITIDGVEYTLTPKTK